MRSVPHLLLWCTLCGVTPSFAATQIYRYTDDAGTLTFTNELQSIPRQYRHRAVPLYTEITSSAGVVAPVQPQASPEPATRVVTVSSDYRMGAHDSRSDAVRVRMAEHLFFLQQDSLARLDRQNRGPGAAQRLDRIAADCRHVEAKILVRLTGLDDYTAGLAERAATLDREVGAFDRLDCHDHPPLDNHSLADAQTADLFGGMKPQTDVLPFARTGGEWEVRVTAQRAGERFTSTLRLSVAAQ